MLAYNHMYVLCERAYVRACVYASRRAYVCVVCVLRMYVYAYSTHDFVSAYACTHGHQYGYTCKVFIWHTDTYLMLAYVQSYVCAV
jgi:hypothetical protein